MSRNKIFALGLITGIFSACVYNSEEDLYPANGCETESISYTQDVINILENNSCIGCHNTNNPAGSVNLNNYDDVKIFVDNNALLGSIKHSDGFKAMPPNSTSKIDACEIDKIEAWIYDGAQNN